MTSEAISYRVTQQSVNATIEEWIARFAAKSPMRQRHDVYFTLFAVSVFLSTYARMVGVDSGFISGMAALLGGVTCGWSWLFVRSLFIHSSKDNIAPLMAVLLIFVLQLLSAAGAALGGGDTHVLRLTSNMVGMVGSTFVILILVEIVRHVPDAPKGPEHRFRLLFAAGNLALIMFAVFLVDGAVEGTFFSTHTASIQSAAALTALGGSFAALMFRRRYPLTQSSAKNATAREASSPTSADRRLAKRVEEFLSEPEIYTQTSLKVADVAAQLGEPEYRVSKAITQGLGHPNFNRYINRYRIERAQIMLCDPELSHRSILAIAFDCGFGSIGPFNRAFRDIAGVTPTAYRRQYDGRQ